jgi:alpha-L-fucosidase 2
MDIQTGAELDCHLAPRPNFFLNLRGRRPAILWLLDFTPLFTAAFVVALMSPFACGQAAKQNSDDEPLLTKPPVSIFSYTSATIPSMPLAERISRGVVPKRGLVSTGVDGGTLLSGDGKIMVELAGNPLSDEVIFRHERVLQPWKRPFEAPRIASVLPQVKKLILAGHYREALELSLQASTNAGLPPGMMNHSLIPPFTMRIEIPKAGKPKDYLRTLDFESGEIKVHWTDDRGDWVRQTFVSRPDHVAVQYLVPPKGQTLDATIAINTDLRRRGGPGDDAPAGRNGSSDIQYERDFNEHRMIVIGRFSPEFGNIGFAGVTRVVTDGGSVRVDDGTIVIRGAQS